MELKFMLNFQMKLKHINIMIQKMNGDLQPENINVENSQAMNGYKLVIMMKN